MQDLWFIYRNATFPDNPDLILKANVAAQVLKGKIIKCGLSGPIMDEAYRTRFYRPKLDRLDHILRDATYHLIWGLSGLNKSLQEAVLIDHGAGLGFLGHLAASLEVGMVIYNDIDKTFLDAAKGIAEAVGERGAHYVLGDVDTLVDYMRDKGIDADVLVSYDVLEHIYDNEYFLSRIAALSRGPLKLFMSSGANMFNARYVLRTLPKQIAWERRNKQKRTDIIRSLAPQLAEREVEALARASRLLVRDEICQLVRDYNRTGAIRVRKKKGPNRQDPFWSNTVDPESGWWDEHFMSPYALAKILRKANFAARVMAGYYGSRGWRLNRLIRVLGNCISLPIAPFYSIHAERRE